MHQNNWNAQMNSQSAARIDEQWLLLRGLAREARHWGSFPQDLRAALEVNGKAVRVEALDLPGAGRYSEMKSPLTIAGITDFVRDKYLDIRERQRLNGERPASKTFLVAVSLGGMIAARWLERWPDDLAGCVLVNTSFRGVSPVFHRLSPPAVMHLSRILRTKSEIDRETHVLKMISNRPELHEETAKAWAKFQLERPVSIENFSRQLLAAALFRPTLEKPSCSVLVVGSRGDRMVSPECSTQIANRWQAQFVQHPDAGHDLPLDDPRWLIEQIRSFDFGS